MGQANAITANTAKNGITDVQATAITDTEFTVGQLAQDSADNFGIFELYAKKSDLITTEQANAITANTAKNGITTEQANAITANTAKNGITTEQATAITANTAKNGITDVQ